MSVNQTSLFETESAERHAFAFRIALAAALGFTFGEVQGWHFPFLPALLAVQLLSAQRSLDFKKAVGFVVLMTLGCVFSLLIALIFIDRPLTFIFIMGLLIFLEFLALAHGKAAAGIFLITTTFVPMIAIGSFDLAYALVHNLIVGSILALLLTFLTHA